MAEQVARFGTPQTSYFCRRVPVVPLVRLFLAANPYTHIAALCAMCRYMYVVYLIKIIEGHTGHAGHAYRSKGFPVSRLLKIKRDNRDTQNRGRLDCLDRPLGRRALCGGCKCSGLVRCERERPGRESRTRIALSALAACEHGSRCALNDRPCTTRSGFARIVLYRRDSARSCRMSSHLSRRGLAHYRAGSQNG